MVDENRKTVPLAVIGGGIVFVLIGVFWVVLSRQSVPLPAPISSPKATLARLPTLMNYPTSALVPSTAMRNSQPSSTPPVAQTGLSQNPAQIPRVTLEQSKTAFDSGTAVFLDVRAASSFAKSHIPGALNIPVGELVNRLTELNPSNWIITYCT